MKKPTANPHPSKSALSHRYHQSQEAAIFMHKDKFILLQSPIIRPNAFQPALLLEFVYLLFYSTR